MKRTQLPSFGDWNQYDEVPITQYFESAIQAGLVRNRTSHCSEQQEEESDLDLFYFSSPVKPIYQFNQTKVQKCGEEREYSKRDKVKQRKQVAIRPMDEDLYKISPELLNQKPRRRFLRSLFTGCLGLNCIA